MQKVLIVGAGRIGSLIACLLNDAGDYDVHLADIAVTNSPIHKLEEQLSNRTFVQLDIQQHQAVADYIKQHKINTLISSLPHYRNSDVLQLALDLDLHYFDLTEDTKAADAAMKLGGKRKSLLASQCGLAPGFISILANDLIQGFDAVETVKMRVGALPVNVSNALQYSLAWSVEGLINQYGNLCDAIIQHKRVSVLPLEGLEEIKIDGLTYEAFHTSGGIGTLLDTYEDRVKQMDYKTIRYPGHCARMRLLMNDLRLNENRKLLCEILDNALPKTFQDVVLVYVSVIGEQAGQLIEKNYVKKFYPKTIQGITWSAIQVTTAANLCAILDMTLNNLKKYSGHIRQEDFSLAELLNNRFGKYYE